MSTTLEIDTITQTVSELIDQLIHGDELILTRNHQPVAKLLSLLPPPPPKPRPAPGWMKGVIVYMAPDFDEPLEDLKEYME